MNQKSILIGFIAATALLGGFLVIKEVSNKSAESGNKNSSLVSTSTASTTLVVSSSTSTSTSTNVIQKLIKKDSIITFEEIANARFYTENDGWNTFKDGIYIDYDKGDSVKGGNLCGNGTNGSMGIARQESSKDLPTLTYFDYDKDSDQDALVLVKSNACGTGVYYDFFLYRNDGGNPTFVQILNIGDRTPIAFVRWEYNTLSIAFLDQGKDEGSCCASTPHTKDYKFNGTGLDLYRDTLYEEGGYKIYNGKNFTVLDMDWSPYSEQEMVDLGITHYYGLKTNTDLDQEVAKEIQNKKFETNAQFETRDTVISNNPAKILDVRIYYADGYMRFERYVFVKSGSDVHHFFLFMSQVDFNVMDLVTKSLRVY